MPVPPFKAFDPQVFRYTVPLVHGVYEYHMSYLVLLWQVGTSASVVAPRLLVVSVTPLDSAIAPAQLSLLGGVGAMVSVNAPPAGETPLLATRTFTVVPWARTSETDDWVPLPQPPKSSLQPRTLPPHASSTCRTVSWVVPVQVLKSQLLVVGRPVPRAGMVTV